MKPTRSLTFLLPLLLLALTAPLALAAEGGHEESSNIIQTIMKGGPLIVMIWIGILGTSMTMLTFIIQLFIVLRDEQLAPSALVESLQTTIQAGNYQEAWEICRANKAYVAQVLKGALERLGRGKEAVETALIEHGIREAQILKTKNSYLSVIGVIAPMIGLLGTVIGMMGAFAVLGASGVADPGSSHWRGAHGDSQRSLHRDPRLHFLLLLPESRDHRPRQLRRQTQPPDRGHSL